MSGGNVQSVMKQGTVALLTVLAVSVGACGSRDTEPVQSVPAMGFVDRFAPLVHLQPGEPRPLTSESFLAASTLYWVDGRGGRVEIAGPRAGRSSALEAAPPIQAERLGIDAASPYEYPMGPRPGCDRCKETVLTSDNETRPFAPDRSYDGLRAGEGFVLDLDPKALKRDEDRWPPVYVTVDEDRSNFGAALWVTYWMLFENERPPGDPARANEGDWERVGVLLNRADRGATYEPVKVRYYQDNRRRDVPWDAAEVIEAGPGEPLATHPVVYLRRGDHTPFPRPRPGANACEECPPWHTWRRQVNADTQGWWSFGGAWGDAGSGSASTGPFGPSFYLNP